MPRIFRTIIGSTLFAGVALALGTGEARAEPLKGAFGAGVYVNPGVMLEDGGEGAFSAHKQYSFGNKTSGISGEASASLRDGTLHSLSFASNACQAPSPCLPPLPPSRPQYIGLSSGAYFYDQLIITADGLNLALVPVDISIDGFIAESGMRGGGGAAARVKVGIASAGETIDPDRLVYEELTETQTNVLDTLVVRPGIENIFNIYVELLTVALVSDVSNGFALADFGNTLHFNIDLPEGVTMRSVSGVFLTEAGGTPVPEPAALGLFAAGLGALGMRGARRVRVS